jgi:hypothetical protein
MHTIYRTLVSEGAVNFTKKHGNGVTLSSAQEMISPSARQTWIKWKDRLEKSDRSDIVMGETDKENLMQDTVGAVAWHPRDGFAAGVSRLVQEVEIHDLHTFIDYIVVGVFFSSFPGDLERSIRVFISSSD